jgi:RNA polymerase sigma-70 factor (ECF subfamily)
MDSIRQDFKRIFEEYHQDIFRFVAFKVVNKEGAEDITAAIFLRFWEKMRTGEVIDNPRAFLYHISRTAVIDEYRRRERHKTVPLEMFIEETFIIETDLMEKDTAIDYARVLTAIKNLKEEYQEVILMHYVEEIPVSEIATILNESENNTRVRLHRALEKLREKFKHERK